ncbi:MAG TPA: hypothetical protein VG106_07280 [Vicinamibacterales bacterium]|nr:hypothetical protein [Vicinamibacterales bacterium]
MSVPTQGNPANALIGLGFNWNGYVAFVFAGANGNFVTNTPAGAWMQANLGMLGGRTLRSSACPARTTAA